MGVASEVRVAADVLSEFERAELARIEREIDAAEESHAKAVGRLLLEVREKRLWREGYGSFDEYVESRHKFRRSYAWALAGFADVARDVPEIGGATQAKPLIALSPAERKAAWDEAKEAAGGGPVQAKHIKDAAEKIKRPRKPGADATPDEIEDYLRGSGIVPEGGEVWTDRFGDPESEDEPEPEPDVPTDEEWLATLPARGKLPPESRKHFDADALLFRDATAGRLAYVESVRPLANAAKKAAAGHIGPWLEKTYRYFQLNDPSRWEACGDCGGTGRLALLGKCPACRGHGFIL